MSGVGDYGPESNPRYPDIDLFKMVDGTPVLSREDWWIKRRPEIFALVKDEFYGTNFPGFSSLAADGGYVGFDIDFCRAVAAAVGVRLRTVPLSATDRFPSLQANTVDMLSMVTTVTATASPRPGA